MSDIVFLGSAKSSISLRQARIEDAPVLARLANEAGEGLPAYIWGLLAQPGQSAWEVGIERVMRETGSFSYRNAVVAEDNGAVAGCVIGYGLPEQAEAVPHDMPAMFRALQELENEAPGTWYVNFLAVHPEYRGRGLGTRLLGHVDLLARQAGCRGMSLIAADSNARALRLYSRCGYRERDRRPMVKDGWNGPGKNWILMTKRLRG